MDRGEKRRETGADGPRDARGPQNLRRLLTGVKPWMFGLAFVHMWIYCVTHRPVTCGGLSLMAVMYSALSVALALMLLAALKGRGRPARPLASPALDLVACVCMMVPAVVLTLETTAGDDLAVGVASTLGGLGVGMAYLRWCEVYARLDIRLAAPLVFLTMAVGSVGKAVIDLLPAVPAALVLVVLPPLTFFCAAKSRRAVEGRESSARQGAGTGGDAGASGDTGTGGDAAGTPGIYYNARTIGSLGRIAAGVAVYSLAFGIIQSVWLETIAVSGGSIVAHHAMEVVVALLVVAWVGIAGRGLDFSRMWRIISVLVATALLFEPFLTGAELPLLLALVRTAQTFLIVFLFLALADVARHSPFPTAAVFCAGWLSYALPFAVGKMAGDGLAAGGAGLHLVSAALIWLVVVVMLFVLDDAAMGNRLIFADLDDAGDADDLTARVARTQRELGWAQGAAGGGTIPQADPLTLRCQALAKEVGLTPREEELLELLARGHTKAHVAEAFFISENTVRNHVKHIYAKVGVHTREELLAAVEGQAV